MSLAFETAPNASEKMKNKLVKGMKPHGFI